MKNRIIMPIALLSLFLGTAFAQEDAFLQLARENLKTIEYDGSEFSGEGWQAVLDNTQKSQNVLIGEDHFSNEIPAFASALAQSTTFDNLFIEVDPYSTQIIENSIRNLSPSGREAFNKEFSHLFLFYALKPEYEFLEKVVGSGTNLLGSEQVVAYADRLIFNKLAGESSQPEMKEIYLDIMQKSRSHLDSFLENPQNPMYFMTPEFGQQLDKLEALDIGEYEKGLIEDIKYSIAIYTKMSHKMRVRLLLHQVMDVYPEWKDKRNLFKFGANHMARGESLLTVFDIGNLVANITESNFKESYHLMIVGESGLLGTPFKSFPATKLASGEDHPLSFLKPFFDITEGKDWSYFDLRELRKAFNKKQFQIENDSLRRVINGFDALVIIPEVTAAEFLH